MQASTTGNTDRDCIGRRRTSLNHSNTRLERSLSGKLSDDTGGWGLYRTNS
jgi:hypothetical protein